MVEIGVIGGDGIGPEVVRAGMKVLEAAAMDDPSLELGLRSSRGAASIIWSTDG